MAQLVSEFVINRLADWGIRRIFGYPDDGVNALLGALSKATDTLEFVQVQVVIDALGPAVAVEVEVGTHTSEARVTTAWVAAVSQQGSQQGR
jgi:thiamine pyrophosphate-dependent acetolactate synthase large subunit-like protein